MDALPRVAASSFRRTFLLAGGAAFLAGCGFQLRGAAVLPVSRIYLDLPPQHFLARELRVLLRGSPGLSLESGPQNAELIVAFSAENRARQVISLNASGQVRELRLLYSITVRAHDSQGREWLLPEVLEQYRDVSYNETAVLAKDYEENLLYQNMIQETAVRLVRRLSTLKGSRFDPSASGVVVR